MKSLISKCWVYQRHVRNKAYYSFLHLVGTCRQLGILEVLSRQLRDWKKLLSPTGALKEYSCLEDGWLCSKRLRNCLQLWPKVKIRPLRTILLLMKQRRIWENHLWLVIIPHAMHSIFFSYSSWFCHCISAFFLSLLRFSYNFSDQVDCLKLTYKALLMFLC